MFQSSVAVMSRRATSAKMAIVLLRVKKDGKCVSAIVKVAIGEVPSVRMANRSHFPRAAALTRLRDLDPRRRPLGSPLPL
jgi:hypothetical protein